MLTIDELLAENKALREAHAKDAQVLRWTLRDSFASATLTGLLAPEEDVSKDNAAGYARLAYDFAEAMLVEREKRIAGVK